MVDASLLPYREYTRRVHRMLYLGGVLQDRTRSVIWSYITGFLVILLCFSQCVFSINFGRDHTDNLVVLTRCFSFICSFIGPLLMSVCFLVKREKLMELHETLNDLFERELTRDRKTKETMLAILYVFERPSYILSCTLGLTAFLTFGPPLISIVRQIVRHIEPKKYRLPFPNKFPWPINGYLFYLHFLYQIFCVWCLIFTISSVDSLFSYYTFQISSILRAMAARLTNPRTREVFTEVLNTCVQTHHQLLRCCHMLNDIWGLIIIRILSMNAMLICALIFEASPFTHLTVSQLFLFASFMTIKLLQTFIYGWYGSLITSASEHFREGIYFSKWPESSLDRNVRTSVIVMMMQKPMIIRALKLTSVNINMFTNILNTAMSYFFLLQSLDGAK